MSRRIALFIGNSTYDDLRLTRLKTPAADVRELAATFRDSEIGGFDEVRELVDENEATVRRSIADFFAKRHPEDLLLLYFSGHGVKDDRGRLYLAVRDSASDQLSATAIASAFITEHMDECRSKRQILILDCCNSGAFARGTKGTTTALTSETFAGNGYGRVVLTASDATQYALEGDQVIEQAELSLFTHYLLEGLNRGIPTTDEVITLDALYDHVYGQIVNTTPKQTPRKWVYNQQGSLVLAKNRGRLAPVDLTLPDELRSRIESTQANTRRIAIAELGRMLDSGDRTSITRARAALLALGDSDRSKIVREAAREALASRAPKTAISEPNSPSVSASASPLASTSTTTPPLASATASSSDTSASEGASNPNLRTSRPSAYPMEDLLSDGRAAAEKILALPLQDSAPIAWFSALPRRRAWILAFTAALAFAAAINGGILGPSALRSGRTQPLLTSGIIEGLIIAAALFLFFRTRGTTVDPKKWFGAVVAAYAVRWQIPIFGFPYEVGVVAILFKGAVDGVLIGAAQSWALGLEGARRVAWIAAFVLGSIVSVFFFVPMAISFTNMLFTAPMFPSVLMGTIAGLILGVATSVPMPKLLDDNK